MSVKSWSTKPSHDEVRAYLQSFFDTLFGGELERAEAMVTHAYEDWNENIYNLFQDHYLVEETPPDSTFEGNWWKTNREWLANFSVKEGAEWMGKLKNVAWIDILYRGEPSGYIAEFQLAEQDGGGFVVQHDAFRMA